MDARDFLLAELDSGEFLLLNGVKDLVDSEFYVRLPNAGESADWLFGHVAVNEDFFLSKLTGSNLQVAENIRNIYLNDFPPTNIAQGLLPREGMIQLFRDQRQRVKQALAAEDTSTWDVPAPPGLPPIFKTKGAVWGIVGTHQYWHIGQLMTIRTMLGKPAFQFSPQQQAPAAPLSQTMLTIPVDGPRVRPRLPDQVSPYVRAELDKATDTWGIPNHLARTMACHPELALTEVDYANSFIFMERFYAETPKPGAETSGQTVLFPTAGFVDRVTKELVITLVSCQNRSRYSITHHTMIGYSTLSLILPGETPEEKSTLAEALLLNVVDGDGHTTYRNQMYKGKPLYSDYQVAALEIAEKTNQNPHLVTDADLNRLRGLMRLDALRQIAAGPLALQFGSAGPDSAYVEAFVDGMMVELTWCTVHFSGLLNRWFTLLKMRDEEFDVGNGHTFVENYNATVPASIKVRNNSLLGQTGWGQ
jgi:hypothetical protein